MPAKRSLLLQVLLFIAMRLVFHTQVRMVYPFLPIFGRGLGVDLYSLSLGVSLRSASGLIGPFLADVGDRYGRRAGMLLGAGLLTAAMTLMWLWPSYPSFVAMLLLGLLASFVFQPAMQAYLGDQVPFERRGRVLGFTELGWSFSFILGVPAVGLIIARSGWRAPFFWLALCGLLILFTLRAVLPAGRPPVPGGNNLLRNIGLVFRPGATLAGLGLGLTISGANELVNLVFGVWLEQAFQVKVATLAVASLVIGFSELGGELGVSFSVDRLGKRRAIRLGLVGNMVAVAALLVLGSSLPGALLGLFFFYATFEFTIVSALPLMTAILPEARATYMATFLASTAVGRSLGSLVAPWLYQLGLGLNHHAPLMLSAFSVIMLNLLAIHFLRFIAEGEQLRLGQPQEAHTV